MIGHEAVVVVKPIHVGLAVACRSLRIPRRLGRDSNREIIVPRRCRRLMRGRRQASTKMTVGQVQGSVCQSLQMTDSPELAEEHIGNVPPIHVPPVAQGAEYQETGDPEWIDAGIGHPGALPGDLWAMRGRWRERIYPTEKHLADVNQDVVCRVGLRQALDRLWDAVNVKDPNPTAFGGKANDDPTVVAMIATYDALEWIHSFDEYLRKEEKTYESPSKFDPVHGPYVEGALGARNASHHGVRRVVGLVDVQGPIYALDGRRWTRTGLLTPQSFAEVRWVEELPGEPLRSKVQQAAYSTYLAGRNVRNTFAALFGFFFFSVVGEAVPDGTISTHVQLAPAVDPRYENWVPGEGFADGSER